MKAILFLLLIIVLSACNGSETNKANNPQIVKNEIPADARYFFNPPAGQPGHNPAFAVGAPLLQRIQTSNTQNNVNVPAPTVVVDPNDTRPNPKHGEPGHRCDIPVGTPLNTPAQTQAVNTVSVQKPKAMPSPGYDPNDTRPNPKHGEPGHRCDIPVGTPLNTLPPKQPATVASNTPVTPVYDPNDTRPNPKHGEPDHRCDIAVGQPLNSRPPQQSITADTAAIKTVVKTGAK